MNAAWWSQPFPPEGSAASEGIRRQLGAPKLDPLVVLVREAAQNSVDARSGTGPVDFTITINRPADDIRRRWCDQLLPEPADGPFGLAACLNDESSVMLTVSDRNTTGLGGPLRANQVGEDADFVKLIRNIGEPRDKAFGGGTYGFGKGILFNVSSVGALLIRSRCLWQDRVQTRLIGVALGHSYQSDGVPFTGRHWWGVVEEDGVLDPLLDDQAEQVSRDLGLPQYAEPDSLGTDIVVIGADLGRHPREGDDEAAPRDVDAAAEYLASAMLWNLWPLLTTSSDGSPAATCCVRTDTRTIAVPDPATVPRLWPFVSALRAIDSGGAKSISRRQPTPLNTGSFYAVTAMASGRRDWRDIAAPFTGPAHHCALMRQVGLIVTYREGPALPGDDQQYGAVFRSSREADDAFAAAEPPTHDAWVTNGLAEIDRRTVETALRGIQTRLSDIVVAALPSTDKVVTQPPLAPLSQRLGHFVASAASSQSGGIHPGPRSGGSGRTRRLAAKMSTPELMVVDGRALITATVDVPETQQTLWLFADALVALDVGHETDPPTGAAQPRVIEWRSDNAQVTGNCVRVTPSDPRRWIVLIEPAVDAVTEVTVRLDLAADADGALA